MNGRLQPSERLSGGYPAGILTDGELRRDIERRIEQAADARRYGGPAHAEMYLADLRILLAEQTRRAIRP